MVSGGRWDVIVIGGGSAGTSAGAAAAAAGARTAVINDGELGGLCILRGCMPTKAMLASAHARGALAHLDHFGIELEGTARTDFARVMARKDAQVARFKRAKVQQIGNADFTLIDGRARFAPGGGLIVTGPQGEGRIEAGSYVIATGSVTSSIPIDGLDRVPVLDSDGVMRLTQQPQAVLVQGAGPIGLELAQFFAEVGTRVLLVNRSPLLKTHDHDLGEELLAALRSVPNLEVAAPGHIAALEPRAGGLHAVVETTCDAEGAEGRRRVRFDADVLLMATGREPALADLGLEHTGARVAKKAIAHDAGMRTDDPRVWVAGDATGAWQILHLANQEGRVAGHNAARAALGLEAPALRMNYRLRMQTIFTAPCFAEVGRTRADCEREGLPWVEASRRFPKTGRAITMGAEHGIWRLIAHAETGELLGTQCLGPRADDLVHVISACMHFRGTVGDLLAMPWYHPTLSEVLLSIARDLEEQIG
jgi:pyruvate/2-oxoglutarate dehydrogenase complex dihydrolipoamide dehydrogenase (E3) component